MRARLPLPAIGTLLVVAATFVTGCSVTNGTLKPQPTPPVDSLAIAPDTATVAVGATFRFSASAYDSAGALIGGAALSWTSAAPAVFSVDGSGRVTGESEGSAFLFVTAGAARDSAWVHVTAPVRGWFTQPSGAGGIDLNGVFFLAGGRDGWVVGDGGKVLRTDDAGSTWTTQTPIPSAAKLNSVWFVDANEGWIVGDVGAVLHTTNGGRSWARLLNVPASETLMDVQFAGRDTGWVVGANGVVLRTFNRGASWTRVVPTPFDLNAVSFAGNRDGWAVGDNGVILGTHDAGRSWFIVQPAVTAQSLRGLWRTSESRANAVGAGGVTPRTVAGPDSTRWELVNAGALNQLEAVHFPSALTGFAVGFNSGGQVLRSDDGGASWQPQAANTFSRLNDVCFVDAQRGWAVGANGTIVHTVTGGQP